MGGSYIKKEGFACGLGYMRLLNDVEKVHEPRLAVESETQNQDLPLCF